MFWVLNVCIYYYDLHIIISVCGHSVVSPWEVKRSICNVFQPCFHFFSTSLLGLCITPHYLERPVNPNVWLNRRHLLQPHVLLLALLAIYDSCYPGWRPFDFDFTDRFCRLRTFWLVRIHQKLSPLLKPSCSTVTPVKLLWKGKNSQFIRKLDIVWMLSIESKDG